MNAIWINEYACDISDDETGFLVCTTYNNERGRQVYSLRQHPVHTNQSHEPRLDGWCGETNNVSVQAEGLAMVARRARNGRICLRRVETTLEALEAIGYPALMPSE